MNPKSPFLLSPETKSSYKSKYAENRNIINNTIDVSYEMDTSKNCPIPPSIPRNAKESLQQIEATIQKPQE